MAGISRAEAIEKLHDGQSRLEILVARLSDEEMVEPGTIGGGDWSAKDLIGHIAWWEEIAMDALTDWRAGRRPSVEEDFGREGGVDARFKMASWITAVVAPAKACLPVAIS